MTKTERPIGFDNIGGYLGKAWHHEIEVYCDHCKEIINNIEVGSFTGIDIAEDNQKINFWGCSLKCYGKLQRKFYNGKNEYE